MLCVVMIPSIAASIVNLRHHRRILARNTLFHFHSAVEGYFPPRVAQITKESRLGLRLIVLTA
jgi:hypothetical protein